MKKLFLRNGTPFLPINESEERCRQKFYEDIQEVFNLREYVDRLEIQLVAVRLRAIT